ncbi:Rpn family recombination-promoting nuclease/putative transposase [Membranihabitans maritimus]|uniref:Rpn family recombination-promoting nuclease/putative transposase n=1 Tax=Membranihabitans maritimus TaxID=2904244 RepID=UPI0034E2A5BB
MRNPHDKFIKALLSDIEVSRGYFTEFLPQQLKEILYLEGLYHSGTSFISGIQEEIFADIKGSLSCGSVIVRS